MVRVALPAQLCSLANVHREVTLDVEEPASIATILDELESHYPMLRGTIRDQVTFERRPFIRYFVCGEDVSQESATDPLPEDIITGKEVLRVVGAMAGG
jgi:molybdopterin synthase sulfur carrier subunit